MRRNTVWRVLVLAVLVMGLGVFPAFAQHPGTMGEMGSRGPGAMFYLLFKGANLTPDQEAKVKEILKAHREKTRELAKHLRATREEMTDKLFAPGPLKADDLQPVRQRSAQLWEQLSQDRLAAALEIRAVLTQEQLSKTEKLKDRFRQLRKETQALFEGKQQ